MSATTRDRDGLLDAALQMTFPASHPIAVDPPVPRRRTAAPGAPRRPRERESAGRGRTAAPGRRK